MEIIYTLRPGTRYAVKTQRHYPVMEIIVAGDVVGSLHSGDAYLFGEVQWPDGTRQSYGDCTLDTGGARDSMVKWIMARRTLPPTEEKWRGTVHKISAGWSARRES